MYSYYFFGQKYRTSKDEFQTYSNIYIKEKYISERERQAVWSPGQLIIFYFELLSEATSFFTRINAEGNHFMNFFIGILGFDVDRAISPVLFK